MGTERSGDCGIRVVMEESIVSRSSWHGAKHRGYLSSMNIDNQTAYYFRQYCFAWIIDSVSRTCPGKSMETAGSNQYFTWEICKKTLKAYDQVKVLHECPTITHKARITTVNSDGRNSKIKINLRMILRRRKTKRITSQRTDNPLAMDSWPPSAGDRT